MVPDEIIQNYPLSLHHSLQPKEVTVGNHISKAECNSLRTKSPFYGNTELTVGRLCSGKHVIEVIGT